MRGGLTRGRRHRGLQLGLADNVTLEHLAAHGNGVRDRNGMVVEMEGWTVDQLREALPAAPKHAVTRRLSMIPSLRQYQLQDDDVVVSVLKEPGLQLGLVIEDATGPGELPLIAECRPGTLAFRDPTLVPGLGIQAVNGCNTVGMKASEVAENVTKIKEGKFIQLVLVGPGDGE